MPEPAIMSHELPLPLHQKKAAQAAQHKPAKNQAAKTNKHRPVTVPERQLPSGKNVDFGHGNRKKHDTLPEPTLPSGAKPNFYNDLKSETPEHPNTKAPVLPSGDKPNFGNKGPKKGKKVAEKAPAEPKQKRPSKKGTSVPEETYAGSSFHSSPAALNLPKPTFKTSPKSAATAPVGPTMAALPGMTPPQFPATAYPPGSGIPPNVPHQMPHQMPHHNSQVQPGFSYQVTPQGHINYSFPHGAPPVGYPMVTSHYQYPGVNYPPARGLYPPPPQQFHVPHVQAPQQQASQGQKISFNDLLGSAK